MDTIRMTVNGHEFPARSDATILEATRESYEAPQVDIYIPTLQYLKGLQEIDETGVCIAQVEGTDGFVDAFTTKVEPGMVVTTNSPEIRAAQKEVVDKILAIHDQDCRNCFRTGNCELQALGYLTNTVKNPATAKLKTDPIDESAIIVRDSNKCVRCGRCIAVCQNIQAVGALERVGEGLEGRVQPKGGGSLNATNCVNCGQCIAVCPVGALHERNDIEGVFAALKDPEKYVVIQAAPSVRAGIGELFGFPIGSETEGRLAAALRRLGFDGVFDTKFGADLTIMEEATEFVDRLNGNGALPMITSCCPSWVKYAEHNFSDFLPNISTTKSPQQIFGAAAKGYLAKKNGIDPANIVVVSAMPCTAKKFELTRDNEAGAGYPDVDFSITNRELAHMIELADIDFSELGPEPFDSPLGEGSGAGAIFGVTGGVMEAALRTAADWLAGEELTNLEYEAVRGFDGVKEASYTIAGREIHVAAVNGLAHAKALLESVRAGEAKYDFIEIMACPGGCVNGGGQPVQVADVRNEVDLRSERGAALYSIDERSCVRKSHDNPDIKALYGDYVGEPGGETAHKLFHTSYAAR